MAKLWFFLCTALFLWIHPLLPAFSFQPTTAYKCKIGLCVMATGRYSRFVAPLVESARKFFCKKYNVTFFVFTDGTIPVAPDIVRIQQKRLGWPYDTMLRPEVYYGQRQAFNRMDYLFSIDADMRFVDVVDEEILSTCTATRHPGFIGKRGSYEINKLSLAYVKPNEGKMYFCGGFWGGSRGHFLLMCKELSRRIRVDMDHRIIPCWHEESHLNRFLIDFPPAKVLTPSYCYPEGEHIPFHPRLIAIYKNHAEVRK